MIIIGEKINSSIPGVAAAIERRDREFIQKLAKEQVAAGADIIDVNAGAFLDEETELLPWLVNIVQEAVDAPLCIDSPNPAALAAALKVAKQKALVNSISAEEDRYAQVLPLLKRHRAAVIAMCMDGRGIPGSANERVEIARGLAGRLLADGLAPEDIYLDVVVQPVATDTGSGVAAIEAVRAIREEMPDVHITCGLSNVSFGLPKRRLLNQAFAVILAAAGMDAMFVDPLDARLMALLAATKTLAGQDEFCAEYLAAFRAGKLV